MGYDRHNCIVVTTYDTEKGKAAYDQALELFGEQQVTPVLHAPVNQWFTFFVGPDGSKEGWADSDEGDKKREAFIACLRSLRWEDGSSPLDWAEVQYGDDERVTKVTAHSDSRGPEPLTVVELEQQVRYLRRVLEDVSGNLEIAARQVPVTYIKDFSEQARTIIAQALRRTAPQESSSDEEEG